MNKFSEKSLSNLNTCHKDLQTLFNEVIKYFDCTITEGFRNEELQNKAFNSGNSKLKWPNGNHNKYPSYAVDVYPYPIDLNSSNKYEKDSYLYRMAYFAGQVKAIARQLKIDGKISHEVIWGCDWKDNTNIKENKFLDFPHFELKNEK